MGSASNPPSVSTGTAVILNDNTSQNFTSDTMADKTTGTVAITPTSGTLYRITITGITSGAGNTYPLFRVKLTSGANLTYTTEHYAQPNGNNLSYQTVILISACSSATQTAIYSNVQNATTTGVYQIGYCGNEKVTLAGGTVWTAQTNLTLQARSGVNTVGVTVDHVLIERLTST